MLGVEQGGVEVGRYSNLRPIPNGSFFLGWNKFWKLHHELFNHQAEWANDNYAAIRFESYAQSAGLDTKKIDVCVSDPATEKSVLEEKAAGQKLGIMTTPSFFINGKLYVGTNGLNEAVSAFLTQKKNETPSS